MGAARRRFDFICKIHMFLNKYQVHRSWMAASLGPTSLSISQIISTSVPAPIPIINWWIPPTWRPQA
jgi:hypothetical protein